jgi:exodeoxyribonuclease VII large subunit
LEEKRQVLKLQDEKLPRSLKLFVNQLYSNFQDVSSKLNTEILKEQLNSNLNNLNNTATHLIKAKKLFLNLRSEKILSLNKLLESLSYKSVINRGYSVIRNSKNKILKSKKDILSDKKLIIESNFGTLLSNLKEEND